MMRKTVILCTVMLTVIAVLCLASRVHADMILITEFDTGPAAYTQMMNNLISAGHSVDVVDVRSSGTLATTLGATSYDQVFLFDLTASLYLNATDVSALGSFWGTHSGLVVDSRSYGYFFQGNDPSEVALLQNVATNLSLSGGGVWVGTDHDPDWTKNGNPFLSEIGVDPVTGIFSDPVNFADPTSVLLAGVTPTDLWGGGASIGMAPIGIQPNGIEMFIHFGHTRADGSIIPYISANFPLAGPVPEPATLTILGTGLVGLAFFRRKLKK